MRAALSIVTSEVMARNQDTVETPVLVTKALSAAWEWMVK
jgi:hypothetical protein